MLESQEDQRAVFIRFSSFLLCGTYRGLHKEEAEVTYFWLDYNTSRLPITLALLSGHFSFLFGCTKDCEA